MTARPWRCRPLFSSQAIAARAWAALGEETVAPAPFAAGELMVVEDYLRGAFISLAD
jgi:hypothetical protein